MSSIPAWLSAAEKSAVDDSRAWAASRSRVRCIRAASACFRSEMSRTIAETPVMTPDAVLDRRDTQRNRNRGSIFPLVNGFTCGDLLPSPDLLQHFEHLCSPFGWHDHADRLANHFVRAITVKPLGPGIPARDLTIELVTDNGIFRVFDDRGQTCECCLGAASFAQLTHHEPEREYHENEVGDRGRRERPERPQSV